MSTAEIYKLQYADMIKDRAQQRVSRAQAAVMTVPATGKLHTYDDMSAFDDIEITTRLSDTQGFTPIHSRRGCPLREFRATPMFDTFDQLAIIANPGNKYVEGAVRTLQIRKDRLILEAARGTVLTGEFCTTSVTAANDGVSTIVHGWENLTFEKLQELEQSFADDEVGVDEGEEMYIAITANQRRALRQQLEYKSSDYKDLAVFKDSQLVKAGAFNLIVYSSTATKPLLTKSGNIRSCIAWAKSGIEFALSQDIQVEVNQRPDKNNAWQAQSVIFANALRTEGKKVKIVQCDETHMPTS
ncbi:MAG: hypothetical protein K2Q12_11120 [Rickettsiales bacterium]|nr:hypothetical protein [Rickettsiales bacterium]